MPEIGTEKSKPCAYCDQPGRSREHYFPQWMHSQFEELPSQMFRSADTHFHDETGRVDHGISTKRLGRSLVKDVERRVCAVCNNGWMSRLTETAKGALEPLLFGSPEAIDTADQILIAKWVAMTIMTVEIGQRYAGVETAERHKFRTDEVVPHDWRIWLARYDGIRWNAAYHRHGAVVGFVDASERASLAGFIAAVGNACFFAMAGAEPNDELEAALEQDGFRSVRPIRELISWQSLPAMSDDDLDQIASFITQQGNSNAEAVANTIANTNRTTP